MDVDLIDVFSVEVSAMSTLTSRMVFFVIQLRRGGKKFGLVVV